MSAKHSDQSRLTLLVEEYKLIHEQRNSNRLIFMTLLGFALATFIGYVTILSGSDRPTAWFTVIAPMGIVLPVGVVLWVGREDVTISLYGRVLENEIRKEIDSEYGRTGTMFQSYENLKLFSSISLLTQSGSSKTSRGYGAVTLYGVSTVFAGAALCMVILGAKSILDMPTLKWLIVPYIVLYASVGLALVHAFHQTYTKSRENFKALVKSSEWRQTDNFGPRVRSNKKINCIVPKIDDLTKSSWGLFGILIVETQLDLRLESILALFTIYLAVFEILFYQTRYLLNDLIGIKQDRKEPAYEHRNKIPKDAAIITRVIENVLFRMFLMLALVVTALLFNTTLGVYLLLSFSALILSAIFYEGIKIMEGKGFYQGRTIIAYVLYLVIAIGYSVRFYIGALSVSAYIQVYSQSKNQIIEIGQSLHSQIFGIPGFIGMLVIVYGLSLAFVTANWVPEAMTWVVEPLQDERSYSSFSYILHTNSKYHVAAALRAYLKYLGSELYESKESDVCSNSDNIEVPPIRLLDRINGSISAHRRLYRYLLTPWAMGILISSAGIVALVDSQPGFSLIDALFSGFLFYITLSGTCILVMSRKNDNTFISVSCIVILALIIFNGMDSQEGYYLTILVTTVIILGSLPILSAFSVSYIDSRDIIKKLCRHIFKYSPTKIKEFAEYLSKD